MCDSIKSAALTALITTLAWGCTGDDGPPGPPGQLIPPGSRIDISTLSETELAQLDLVSAITNVTIASPPVVTFTLKTTRGIPVVGLVPFWDGSNQFVRFNLTKLVPGQSGDPDRRVSYTRNASGVPTADTGANLVDHANGSYSFTFKTDVTAVPGVAYEPALTHRVAGQIGSSSVPLEAQNLWLDFVPAGGPVVHDKAVTAMSSCNECHTRLVFHGRRFEIQYCVQCHNADLAQSEGDFAFMIHRIHSGGKFEFLDNGRSFEHITYPQETINCRKCHNGDDDATPQGNNWREKPNMLACDGCHDVFTKNTTQLHTGGQQSDNARCTVCHSAVEITNYHTTPNSTPNNPELMAGQRKIDYELLGVAVDSSNAVTVRFKILSDGTALDVTALPAEFRNGSGSVYRYPGLLLAYALPQANVEAPADFNNLGRTAGQPISLGLDRFAPIATSNPIGTMAFDSTSGVMTATVTDPASQFPVGAKMRTVALQGYLQQDLNRDGNVDVSLHTISAVETAAGDTARRRVVDTTKCAQCHEFFEGHGGNRVFAAGSALVCVMCHNPNLSSSGREIDVVHPEDAQNFKDMIHGIHSAANRDRPFVHVRNFRNAANVYDWSEVTFPRGSTTANCEICHVPGAQSLPLPAGVLPTTVRTTGATDGKDASTSLVTGARASMPNAADWVNSAGGSACFYCHTSQPAWAHMTIMGAQLSVPDVAVATYINRGNASGPESCAVCHGRGREWDVQVVHGR